MQGAGFTQDLSSRGVFLFTDMALTEGSEVELTLRMPSEITLGENMRVRCRGRVLRVINSGMASTPNTTGRDLGGPRVGVAVRFDSYEYLRDPADPGAHPARAAALHPHDDESPAVQPASTRGMQS